MKLQDEHPIRLSFLAATLTILYLGILIPAGFLEGARLHTYDVYQRWRNALFAPPAETNRLLLVTIDEESQNQLGKKWPWNRAVFAEFLEKISKGQPKVIVFDQVFNGASEPEHDRALAHAIASGPSVILATYLDKHGDPVFPYALFTEAGGLLGLINKPRDVDLTVRNLFAGVRLAMQQDPLYAAEIKAAAIYQNVPSDQIHLEPRQAQLRLGPRTVPLEPPLGVLGINYRITAKQIPSVSFWRVMQDQVSPDQIRGRVVLVGSTREIDHDVYPSSLGLMPGVMISANAIITLLTGQFVRPLPMFITLPMGFLFVLSILLITYWLPLRLALLVTALLTLTAVGGGFLSVSLLNLRAESFSVLILAGMVWLTATFYKYLLLVAESLRLHRRVVTDPVSNAFTERYLRLRLETDWPKWKRSRTPVTILIVQMDRPSVLLQQISWPEVQKRIQAMAETLQHLNKVRAGSVGRLAEDRLAILLPKVTLVRAKAWAEAVKEAFQTIPGRIGFGLASTDQASISSGSVLLHCAETASLRSWQNQNRSVEVSIPSADATVLPPSQDTSASINVSRMAYITSELEDRNRAIEKALTDLRQAHKEMETHFLEVTKSLVMALETKDEYTAGHLERVSRYATRLAQTLHLPEEEIEAVREAALLHDIGKIGLPDEVLHKVGHLTEEEKAVIKQHLAIGAKILEPMKFFKPITALIYHHHERYDGRGYPHGLTGEFIPSGAQIIAIADSFDAMTTHRGYNKPLTVQEALAELRNGAGTQFNPVYVEAFADVVLREGPQLAGYTTH